MGPIMPCSPFGGAANLKGFAHCRRPHLDITGVTLGAETCFAGGLWFLLCGSLRRLWERPSRVFCDVWFLVTFCLVLVSGCYSQFIFFTNKCHFGDGYNHFWYPKPVIWQAWCLHFGTLGDHGAIQGHLGAQERKPRGPDLDDGKHSQSDWSCVGKASAC